MTAHRPTSREELRKRYFGETKPVEQPSTDVESLPVERAFVHHADSGRTIMTAPIREVAAVNSGFLYLKGRFVEADTPNRNGAMWTSEGLELATNTVVGGPLNWLHEETHIVGSLLDSAFVQRATADDSGVGSHIQSTAAMWRFLFPREAAIVEQAAADARLYYSMECISQTVTCSDRGSVQGCQADFGYKDFMDRKACGHLNARESAARFNEPIFLGGAIVVPPVQPGWAHADVEVVRQAAALADQNDLSSGGLTKPMAELMVERILTWANR